MEKQTHTPGPWFIDTSLHVYGFSEPRPLDGSPLGTVTNSIHVCSAKTHANARLIAAGPKMLAALRMVSGCDMPPDILRAVDAAIAEATAKQSA